MVVSAPLAEMLARRDGRSLPSRLPLPHAERRHCRLVVVLGISGVALWSSCTAFVAPYRNGDVVVPRCTRLRRYAGFEFGLAENAGHANLDIKEIGEEDGGGMLITTQSDDPMGTWNTVLGDKELPSKGRHYWEVKIKEKPTNAWEHIGVAEAGVSGGIPLTKNKDKYGIMWSSTDRDTMVHKYLAIDTKKMKKTEEDWYRRERSIEWFRGHYPQQDIHWREKKKKGGIKKEKTWEDMTNSKKVSFPTKDWYEEQVKIHVEKKYNGRTGAIVGQEPDWLPPFKKGMVVGVDVDMDLGTIGFWNGGKYYGPVREYTGKPLDLRGKKLVPAVSVFGRRSGMMQQFSSMEVHTGLEPPPKPVNKPMSKDARASVLAR